MLYCKPIIILIIIALLNGTSHANYVNVGGPSTELVWHITRGFYGGNMRPATTFVMVGTVWKQATSTHKRVDGAWVEIREGGGTKDRWGEHHYLEGIYTLLLPGIYPARPAYRGNAVDFATTTIDTPVEDIYCLDSIVSGAGLVYGQQTKVLTVTLDCLDTSGGWTGDKAFRLDVFPRSAFSTFFLDGATGTVLTGTEYFSYEIKADTIDGHDYIYEFSVEIKQVLNE